MALLSGLYDRALDLSSRRAAPACLGALSFSEAVFFPVPPDAMLIPMVLSRRSKAWLFASIATVASVAGGVVGYMIGVFLFDAVGWPLIEFYGLGSKFEVLREWYREHGIWVVLFAGFTPIPYKLFTIASGAFSMALMPFVVMSAIGRGVRFFLVAAIFWWAGESVNEFVRRHATWIGWGIAAVFVAALAYGTL